MLPAQLTAASFDAYPEAARRIATSEVAAFRRLPLGFLPLLLRELIAYDWKFPAERREIDAQIAYLRGLGRDGMTKALSPFASLRLTAALERVDWVNSPAIFTEQLTAHLWSTHQIDGFRAAAMTYMEKAKAASPEEAPRGHRMGIAI